MSPFSRLKKIFLSKVFIRTLVILAQKFKFRTKIGIMSQCVIAYSVRKKKFLKDGDLENSRVNGNMMIVIWDLRTCNAVSLVTATPVHIRKTGWRENPTNLDMCQVES